MAKEANPVIAKYVDVFVREALARAAYERAEGGGGDGFLEVCLFLSPCTCLGSLTDFLV